MLIKFLLFVVYATHFVFFHIYNSLATIIYTFVYSCWVIFTLFHFRAVWDGGGGHSPLAQFSRLCTPCISEVI